MERIAEGQEEGIKKQQLDPNGSPLPSPLPEGEGARSLASALTEGEAVKHQPMNADYTSNALMRAAQMKSLRDRPPMAWVL